MRLTNNQPITYIDVSALRVGDTVIGYVNLNGITYPFTSGWAVKEIGDLNVYLSRDSSLGDVSVSWFELCRASQFVIQKRSVASSSDFPHHCTRKRAAS